MDTINKTKQDDDISQSFSRDYAEEKFINNLERAKIVLSQSKQFKDKEFTLSELLQAASLIEHIHQNESILNVSNSHLEEIDGIVSNGTFELHEINIK